MPNDTEREFERTLTRVEGVCLAWTGWFRALGDASRVLMLNELAIARRPMTVEEIVDAVDVGQSTVSHHFKLLAYPCRCSMSASTTRDASPTLKEVRILG
jgi:DNA-binding transcriptional ArsR family regulator